MLRAIIDGIVGRHGAWDGFDGGLQWKDGKEITAEIDAKYDALEAKHKAEDAERDKMYADREAAYEASKGPLDKLGDKLGRVGMTQARIELVATLGIIACVAKYLLG